MVLQKREHAPLIAVSDTAALFRAPLGRKRASKHGAASVCQNLGDRPHTRNNSSDTPSAKLHNAIERGCCGRDLLGEQCQMCWQHRIRASRRDVTPWRSRASVFRCERKQCVQWLLVSTKPTAPRVPGMQQENPYKQREIYELSSPHFYAQVSFFCSSLRPVKWRFVQG